MPLDVGTSPQLLKLLETVDKLSRSPGAELRVPSGAAGQPPPELVRTFEEALHKDSPVRTEALNGISPSPSTSGRVEAPPSIEQVVPSVMKDTAALLHNITHGGLTHDNLFRLQYTTAMLNMRVTRVNGISQQATQNIENILKRQD